MTTDGGRLLHELFAAAAAQWPARTAVRDATTRLTYAELDRRANQLAHRLIRSGAGPETLVALQGPRSVELIVRLLGILKAGAGYLPLEPRQPLSRSRSMVADAGCRLVVGADDDLGVPCVPTDALDAEPDTPPEVAMRPDGVAYVIYTSGSTGTPKGAVVSHANAARLFEVTRPEFAFTELDVWTLFHSIAFDFSVWEIWGALLHGGCLVVVPHTVSRDPAAFLRLLVDERVTVLNQTPTAFRLLVRAAEEAGFPPTRLRLLVFGGERLDPALLRGWVYRYGEDRPRVVNMYGITETTVHVTMRPITGPDLELGYSPIGRPLGDLRAHVLDYRLVPVRPGEVGEIYVGGPGVSRGYLGRPGLTAHRFVPDPFGRHGERMYRTGDLAALDADGELVFHGRADNQVQLRGFRIEPGEVEAAVVRHPAVEQAAVVVRDVAGRKRLVCYWAGAAGPTSTDLREPVARRLPDYMVPSVFVRVTELPITSNGKLDLYALPEPGGSAEEDAGRVAPRDTVEEVLAGIWAGLLGLEAVGVHDNFFALGGDSITAIPLVVEATSAGLPVTVDLLFAHPTIAGLAGHCRAAGSVG
jgi:amino acid adenylation domain-containing protein